MRKLCIVMALIVGSVSGTSIANAQMIRVGKLSLVAPTRAQIRHERIRQRKHRAAVHERRAYHRKVRYVGPVPTGTFIGDIPNWFTPRLYEWGGTVLNDDAMHALYDASERVGHRLGGGGFRSHSEQLSLNASKGLGLTAPAGTSLHELGLAVDIMNVSASERAVLLDEGFEQVRSDEPWHFSYGVAG